MKRWSFDVEWMGMYPDENGPWVQADDVISESAALAASRAEIMHLVADLGNCRDELQDWQVAAGVRKDERDVAVKERDAARAEIDELRAVMAEWWVERYQHIAPSSIVEDAEAALRKTA